MRAVAVWIHRYLGLGLGALLLISGLTGTAIVFNKSIDAWLNPALLEVVPRETRVPLDLMLSKVREAVPHERASTVFLSDLPTRSLEIWFLGSDLRAYVDPYSGMVLGTRHATDFLMGFLVDLHIHLLSGETGELIIGWSGFCAILLSLIGLYLWWPKTRRWKQALAIKWSAAPFRLWFDIHRVTGAVMAAFLILTLATGAALALFDIVTEPALIALTGAGSRQPAPLSGEKRQSSAPLAPMLAQAAALFPTGPITRVSLPKQPDSAVMVRMRQQEEVHQFGRTFVWFDQYDGSILRVDNALEANAATEFQSWLYPLHTGVFAGIATRWLQVFVGLSLSLLTISGMWLWLKGWRARMKATAPSKLRGPR